MAYPTGYTYAKRRRQFRELLEQVYEALDNGKVGATEFELVRQHVIDAMTDKDVRRDLFDRAYGKAHQAVSIDGDGEGGPVKTLNEIVLRAVDATDGRPASQDP